MKPVPNQMDLFDCQCSYQCSLKFTMVERIKMNMEFQKLNPAGKKAWISKHCWKDLNTKSQSYNQMICNFPKTSINGRASDKVRVCKKFFLGTLGFQGKSGKEWKFGDIQGETKKVTFTPEAKKSIPFHNSTPSALKSSAQLTISRTPK